jgi:broad specificity phosphatase PhoE
MAWEGWSVERMAALNWQIYDMAPLRADGHKVDEAWEAWEHVGQRTVDSIRRLAAQRIVKGDGREIVVTSHGDVVAAARLWALGQDFTLENRTALMVGGLYPTYCSITTLHIVEGHCVEHGFQEVSSAVACPDGKRA